MDEWIDTFGHGSFSGHLPLAWGVGGSGVGGQPYSVHQTLQFSVPVHSVSVTSVLHFSAFCELHSDDNAETKDGIVSKTP